MSASPRPSPMPRIAYTRLRSHQEPPPGQGMERAFRIVSPDSLALVRFGLRAADDPAFSIQSASSTLFSACNFRKVPAGTATTAMDTANTKTAHPSTAPALAALAAAGWRARPLRTRCRTPQRSRSSIDRYGKLHHRSQPPASRTSLGRRRYPALELFRGKPTAPPVRWCGPIPNTSSSAAPCAIAKFSTSLRKPFSAIKSRNPPAKSLLEIQQQNPLRPRYKKVRLVLMTPALVHWSIDNWKTSTDTPPAIPVSIPTSSTCPPHRCQ